MNSDIVKHCRGRNNLLVGWVYDCSSEGVNMLLSTHPRVFCRTFTVSKEGVLLLFGGYLEPVNGVISPVLEWVKQCFSMESGYHTLKSLRV